MAQRGDIPEKELTVTRRNLPIRHMLKLPQVDGAQKSVETIEQELIDNINSHSIQGAVVSQTVINVPRDTWSLVNLSKVRLAAKASLHYEVVSRPQKDTGSKPAIKKGALGNIDELLEECAKTILADHEREPGVRLARTLLQDQMEAMNASLPKNEEDSRETGEGQKPLEKVAQEETA